MRKYIILYCIVVSVICSLMPGCGTENQARDDSASGSIFGVITDFATGEPVQNANVQLHPSGETALTGYDGTYEFLGIQDGNYAMTVSKAEYSDLIDDYIIEVRNGRRVRRDVQIEKLPTSIRIMDINGNDISTLDYGSDTSTVNKSFNIFNNGTITVNCQIVYSCSWISSVSSIPASISSGQTVPVIVNINRALLPSGQSTTNLTIVTNNGSAEITIKATSATGNPPVVQISQIDSSDITLASIMCKGSVQDLNGGEIKDCGFCYRTSSTPTLDDNVVRLGVAYGSFSYTINNLKAGTTYYIRAFATSNLGTGFSSEISFKTLSGIPACGETIILFYDTTIASVQSTYATDGCEVSSAGFCWSTEHNPTTNDRTVKESFGYGHIGAYLSQLQPGTTYYVRSYAQSQYGLSYGLEKEFTTLSGLATVSTKSATISGDNIMTGGNVTDNSETVIIGRGVCYGPNTNPDLSNSYTIDDDFWGNSHNMGSFTSTIPKPTSQGYIYIRAYATTKYGTSYGNQVSIYIQ